MIKFPQRPHGPRGYGAAPGRANTYFNNPYMAGIAKNLSAAIYGDPQDELTRERITQLQADRQRQAELDEIAANQLAAQKEGAASLAAALPQLYGEDGSINLDVWEKNVQPYAGVLGSEAVAKLLPRDAALMRKLMEMEAGHGYRMAEQDDSQAHDTSEREAGEKHDVRIMGLEQGYETEADKRDALSDVLGEYFGMGYKLPEVDGRQQLPAVAAPSGTTDLGLVFDPNSPAALAAELDRAKAASEGSGGGGSPHKISGTDIKNVEDTIYKLTGVGPETEGYQDIVARALEYYGQTGDPATAVAKAVRDFEITQKTGGDDWIPFNEKPASIKPRLPAVGGNSGLSAEDQALIDKYR